MTEACLAELLSLGLSMTREGLRQSFRRFAAVHFERHAHAADTFAWFIDAAGRSGQPALLDKARAFRTYCIERRAFREVFEWA